MLITFFKRLITHAMPLLSVLAVSQAAHANPPGQRVKSMVTVILDKLPDEFQPRMADFDKKVMNYINNREWIEEDYVAPFTVGLQFFLEYSPSSVEDRYTCSLIASGPDIQYYDKRAVFPFQENEIIQESGSYVPINGLIDYYVFLIIANELDKYGLMEGDKYFEKAAAVLQEAKFSRYVRGWDVREDVFQYMQSSTYKKFREMKDFYFYGLWATDTPQDTRKYLTTAITKLDTVLIENKDLLPAKQFIDAHYQEIVEIFKGANDTKPIKLLMKHDPERAKIYKEYLGTN